MVNKKTFIIIQGHTKYWNFLINQYKKCDNVIWCTDESAANLDEIKKSGIIVETIPYMKTGHGNINIQIATVMKGLKKAKELGASYCIKIRSDMYFSDIKKFIDNMVYDNKIHQLAYVNHFYPHGFPKEAPQIDSWIKDNNFEIENLSGYNYILDFCNYGPIDEMILFWDYPFEDPPIPVPAEHKFIFRYLLLKGEKIDMSFEHISNIFGFFLTTLRELGINLPTLKWNYDYSTLGTGSSKGGFLG